MENPPSRPAPGLPTAAPVRRAVPDVQELWEDYRIFKAAGLLAEWRRKWRAYLPEPAP